VLVALLARVAHAVPTLPELAQDRLVLLLPGSLFSELLDRFLYLGKPILFSSLLLAQVLFGGLLGLLLGRGRRMLLIVPALWLVTGLVLLPLAGHGVFTQSLAVAVATALCFAAYALSFAFFAGWLSLPSGWTWRLHRANAEVTSEPRFDRRRLLAGGALALGAALLARRAIGTLPSLPARGAGASGGAAQGTGNAGGGLPAPVTPAAQFYIVSKNLLDPDVAAHGWRLRVEGMVMNRLSLSYADLLAMPSVTENRTLECISNEVGGDLISNGVWTGVRLNDVLQRAGIQPDATVLRFTSADNYTATMSLSQALDASSLLVYQLDGAPLPRKHGYPVRVLGIGTYGMKNPKWLTRIELLKSAPAGFWQQQGWDAQDIVQTTAQIRTPADGARLAPGATTVNGIAFAGARGIGGVQLSTDGGATWNEAELLPSQGPNTWSFWQYGWQPAQPGNYALVARATDGGGALQTPRRTDPFPAGATGYHEVRVRVSA
jgi:DMSO/TMAO reductase YedYZ molybdopterin-dependent catalytic subunit